MWGFLKCKTSITQSLNTYRKWRILKFMELHTRESKRIMILQKIKRQGNWYFTRKVQIQFCPKFEVIVRHKSENADISLFIHSVYIYRRPNMYPLLAWVLGKQWWLWYLWSQSSLSLKFTWQDEWVMRHWAQSSENS